jgi:hypothetical protein
VQNTYVQQILPPGCLAVQIKWVLRAEPEAGECSARYGRKGFDN